MSAYQYALLGREIHPDGTKLYHVLDCSDRSVDILTEPEMIACLKMQMNIDEALWLGSFIRVTREVDFQVEGNSNKPVLKTAICAIKDSRGIFGVECYNPETGRKVYRVCTERGLLCMVDGVYKYNYQKGKYQGNPKTSLTATYIPTDIGGAALLELHLRSCSKGTTRMNEQYSYFALRDVQKTGYIGVCELIYRTHEKPVLPMSYVEDMYRKDALMYLNTGRKMILG